MGVQRYLIVSVLAIILSSGTAYSADEGFDLRPIVAIGGGVNSRVGGMVGARLRWLPYTPIALEASMFIPYGGGFNVLFDVFRNDRVRVHAFDLGLFWAFSEEQRVVGPKFDRSFDITAGAGIEVRVLDRWIVTADWRWFFPNPGEMLPMYGDFSQRPYARALIGGQIWIGVSYALIDSGKLP